MAVVVGRFSWIARIAVTILLLTGVIQSIALVGSFNALVDTDYGLLVLAKIALFTLLIGLGAYNQRWALPRLRSLAAAGEEPGRAASLLRKAVVLEVGFAVVVIAVTSVLVVRLSPRARARRREGGRGRPLQTPDIARASPRASRARTPWSAGSGTAASWRLPRTCPTGSRSGVRA